MVSVTRSGSNHIAGAPPTYIATPAPGPSPAARVSQLSACIFAALSSGQAMSQTVVSTAQQYKSALDSGNSHIQFNQGTTMVALGYYWDSATPLILESTPNYDINNKPALDANAAGYRAFTAREGSNVNRIKNLSFRYFDNTTNHGGAMHIEGEFIKADDDDVAGISGVNFRHNKAATNGGGLSVQNRFGYGKIQNVLFDSNKALEGSGGGLYAIKANPIKFLAGGQDPEIVNSTFTKNEADANGGGFYANFIGNVQNNLFSLNIAGDQGGGFSVRGNDLFGTIKSNDFLDNKALGSHGGGFSLVGNSYGDAVGLPPSRIISNKFERNEAAKYGGGFYVIGEHVNAVGGAASGEGNSFLQNTAGERGGAFYVEGTLHGALRNSLTQNTAGVLGGGFYALFVDSAGVKNNKFEQNEAGKDGGGFYTASYLKGGVHNNTFKKNRAGTAATADDPAVLGDGGGFYVGAGLGLWGGLKNNLFEENYAERNGGGFYEAGNGVYGGVDTDQYIKNTAKVNGGGFYTQVGIRDSGVKDSTFKENKALEGSGGGFWAGSGLGNSGNGSVVNSWFEKNTAEIDGGGFYSHSSTVSSSTFEYNTAGRDGGGFWAGNGGTGGSWLHHNQAGGHGGGAYATGGGITGSTVEDNKAITGSGGGFNGGQGSWSSTFLRNIAGTSGGGLYSRSANNSSVQIQESWFEDNIAESEDGGGAYTERSALVVKTTFKTNKAKRDGGGAYVANGTGSGTHVRESYFIENTAQTGSGGGLYTGVLGANSQGIYEI